MENNLLIESCKNKLANNPKNVETLKELGELYLSLHRYNEALECYKKIHNSNPTPEMYAITSNQIGVCYTNLLDYTQAIEYFKKVLTIKNDITDVYNNIGTCYVSLKNYKSAEMVYLISSKIKDNNDSTNYALANLYFYMKKYDTSIHHYEKITGKGCEQFIYNLSFPHLAKKNFIKGFKLYETRLIYDTICKQTGQMCRVIIPQILNWNGKDKCNHLLIVYEQGIGDNIQYYRYIIQLSNLYPNMKITYFCKNCVSTILTTYNNINIVEQLSDKETYEYKLFIMSLPHILKISNIVPIEDSYIKTNNEKFSYWKNKLSSLSGLKIGLAYNGLLTSFIEKNIALQEFITLCDLNVNFICIHKLCELKTDIENINNMWKFNFYDIDKDENSSFQDTIAILQNVDLLITVDTAFVHLAGVMGVKTWLLLGYGSDWRWFNDDECHWYKSVELLRMRENIELKNIIPLVKTKLIELIG